MNSNHQNQAQKCTDAQGVMPACAPLANPYVPFQQEDSQTYQAPMGMIRGTMYPGLDLPFMGMVNKNEKSNTPLHRLQALNFAVSELGLYLDTHSEDQDATDLFNQYVEQYADALKQYERQRGSTTQLGSALTGRYDWLENPWPWDYEANMEG